MNKELEALEKIMSFIDIYKGNYDKETHLCNPEIVGLKGVIETALKRLEKYDALNLSCEELQFISNILKNPNDSIEKLKALEMIKEIMSVEEEDFFYDKETDTYFFVGFKVSKEQYDLLKKVLLHYGK